MPASRACGHSVRSATGNAPMRTARSVLQAVVVVALGLSLAGFASLPSWAQTAASASRSIPAFPRPAGFPDPALRVPSARADEAPPRMVRWGETRLQPLYRRPPDGGYAPARAAGYRIAMSSCPSISARGGDY